MVRQIIKMQMLYEEKNIFMEIVFVIEGKLLNGMTHKLLDDSKVVRIGVL